MKNKGGIFAIIIISLIVLLSLSYWAITMGNHANASETEESGWSGVDETVIEKYASAAGREAWEPVINTDQGDMLLFVFALAGIVGGFFGGYCWRMLITGNKS